MSKVLGVSTDEATSHTSVIDAPIPESEQLPDVDESIKRRLNAIKEINNLDGDESKENNTPKDIGQRLASLKGTEYKEYDHKDIIHAKDNRSEQERINDLMKRYAEENEIDESGRGSGTSGDNDDEDPIKSIEKRLAALKGESNTSNKPTNTENQEPVDEAAVVKHIVKKVFENTFSFIYTITRNIFLLFHFFYFVKKKSNLVFGRSKAARFRFNSRRKGICK